MTCSSHLCINNSQFTCQQKNLIQFPDFSTISVRITYGHPGPTSLTWLFKARFSNRIYQSKKSILTVLSCRIIEAGTLSDNSLYTATMEFLTIRRPGFSNGPALAICNDSYCCGFMYQENGNVYSHGGSSAGNTCSRDDFTVLRTQQSNSWRMKLEIHPNRTVGVTYAGTEDAIVHEYSHVLKPSKGLSFHVCRPGTHEFYQFRLFEIALKKIT